MAYTLQEAVNVSRSISEYLEKNPDLLREEGVLRISGNAKHARQIVDVLKNGGPLVLNENYSVHDYVSALEKVIKECSLIAPYQLSELTSPDGSEEKKRASAEAVDTFIKTLITHGNPAAAEMIHNYFHLALMVASHEKENKMGVSNVAIVLADTLAPHMLPAEKEDMSTQMANNQTMLAICKNALQMTTTFHTFDRPYRKSYSKERAPVLAEELHAEKIKEKSLISKVTETDDALAQHRGDLQKVGYFSKRALKKEIDKLKTISGVLKDLLDKNKTQIIHLEKQLSQLTLPPTPSRRATPLILADRHNARPSSQPPSPQPKPRGHRPPGTF